MEKKMIAGGERPKTVQMSVGDTYVSDSGTMTLLADGKTSWVPSEPKTTPAKTDV